MRVSVAHTKMALALHTSGNNLGGRVFGTPKLLVRQSALPSKISRTEFWSESPNHHKFSIALHTPIQNRPKFWSEKLHRVRLQIACWEVNQFEALGLTK